MKSGYKFINFKLKIRKNPKSKKSFLFLPKNFCSYIYSFELVAVAQNEMSVGTFLNFLYLLGMLILRTREETRQRMHKQTHRHTDTHIYIYVHVYTYDTNKPQECIINLHYTCSSSYLLFIDLTCPEPSVFLLLSLFVCALFFCRIDRTAPRSRLYTVYSTYHYIHYVLCDPLKIAARLKAHM